MPGNHPYPQDFKNFYAVFRNSTLHYPEIYTCTELKDCLTELMHSDREFVLKVNESICCGPCELVISP